MRAPVVAYIGLGANLGDAQSAVVKAMAGIAVIDGVRVTGRSALYSTSPVESSGPDYVNAVVEISTQLSAPLLLAGLQEIEQHAGRLRPFHNAPRTLDLDLLLYGDACIDSATLTVPHPRMLQRAFVLVPLSEIAPHKVRPDQLQVVSDQAIRKLG